MDLFLFYIFLSLFFFFSIVLQPLNPLDGKCWWMFQDVQLAATKLLSDLKKSIWILTKLYCCQHGCKYTCSLAVTGINRQNKHQFLWLWFLFGMGEACAGISLWLQSFLEDF